MEAEEAGLVAKLVKLALCRAAKQPQDDEVRAGPIQS